MPDEAHQVSGARLSGSGPPRVQLDNLRPACASRYRWARHCSLLRQPPARRGICRRLRTAMVPLAYRLFGENVDDATP